MAVLASNPLKESLKGCSAAPWTWREFSLSLEEFSGVLPVLTNSDPHKRLPDFGRHPVIAALLKNDNNYDQHKAPFDFLVNLFLVQSHSGNTGFG